MDEGRVRKFFFFFSLFVECLLWSLSQRRAGCEDAVELLNKPGNARLIILHMVLFHQTAVCVIKHSQVLKDVLLSYSCSRKRIDVTTKWAEPPQRQHAAIFYFYLPLASSRKNEIQFKQQQQSYYIYLTLNCIGARNFFFLSFFFNDTQNGDLFKFLVCVERRWCVACRLRRSRCWRRPNNKHTRYIALRGVEKERKSWPTGA